MWEGHEPWKPTFNGKAGRGTSELGCLCISCKTVHLPALCSGTLQECWAEARSAAHTHLGLACHRSAIVQLQQSIQPISVERNSMPAPEFDFGLTYNDSDPSSTVKPVGEEKKRKTLRSKWKWKLLSRVQLFVIPWTTQSMEFSRPEYWSGSRYLLQGIFPTQGMNPGLPYFRQILYQLSYQEGSLLCSDSMDITSRAVIASLRVSLFKVRLMDINGCLNPHTEKLP